MPERQGGMLHSYMLQQLPSVAGIQETTDPQQQHLFVLKNKQQLLIVNSSRVLPTCVRVIDVNSTI